MIKRNSLTFRLLMFAVILALLTGGSVYVRVNDGEPARSPQTERIEAPSTSTAAAAHRAATSHQATMRGATADTVVATAVGFGQQN